MTASAALTSEMARFLEAVAQRGPKPVTSARLPIIATRAQDRARQRCRKLGYARMSHGVDHPKGWLITPSGLEALCAHDPAKWGVVR